MIVEMSNKENILLNAVENIKIDVNQDKDKRIL